MKNTIIPWAATPLQTVWIACEEAAQRRDGKDYGLYGRFRDGECPSPFEFEKALREAGLPHDDLDDLDSPRI